jgi:hypothetical protein
MLVTSTSMREYFREALVSALRKRPVPLTDTAQLYLVNLLAEFAQADKAYAGVDRGGRPVMVDLLARAQDADPQEAVRIYKHMGDSSLYLTGFFAESVEDDLVGVDYYVSMGCGAYKNVAGLIRPTAAHGSALFDELGDRFKDLVDLLAAMSLHGEKTADLDDGKLLALVERYRRTGNPEVLEALVKNGVVLRPGMRDDDDSNVQ